MKANNQYFVLFANCVLTKGAKQSTISDLQRGRYVIIPNLLYEILSIKDEKVEGIKKRYHKNINKEIDKYFSFLSLEEYGFYTDTPHLFPQISLKFYSPFNVISSVICIDEKKYDVIAVLQELDELGCQLLQIRITKKIDLIVIHRVLSILKNSRMKNIEIYMNDYNYIKREIRYLLDINCRTTIVIFNSTRKFGSKSIFSTDEILSNQRKEIFDERLFISNIDFYLESRNLNVGLNRKICVTSDGYVKNYLTHKKDYGNVESIRISTLIETKEFQEKWFINNDKIEKCKDCEFRYMCLSNSDIIKKDSKYFKLNECSYNPYTCDWEK